MMVLISGIALCHRRLGHHPRLRSTLLPRTSNRSCADAAAGRAHPRPQCRRHSGPRVPTGGRRRVLRFWPLARHPPSRLAQPRGEGATRLRTLLPLQQRTMRIALQRPSGGTRCRPHRQRLVFQWACRVPWAHCPNLCSSRSCFSCVASGCRSSLQRCCCRRCRSLVGRWPRHGVQRAATATPSS